MRKPNPGERVYQLRAVVTRIGPDAPNVAARLVARLKRHIANTGHGNTYAVVSVTATDRPHRTLDDIDR